MFNFPIYAINCRKSLYLMPKLPGNDANNLIASPTMNGQTPRPNERNKH